MKEFQSMGHFGARHVHSKILDIYFPRYDENNPQHKALAELSRTSHDKASCWIKDNPPQMELTSNHLGRLRTALKKHLFPELKQIDQIIKLLL